MAETQVLRSIAELRRWRRAVAPSETVGFVPTMGALHEGHLALVRESKARAALTVASIFVNPLQFGPNEDLARYPRPFEKDLDLLRREGTDALFAPKPEEMYPAGASTYVVEEQVSQPLCGAFRPGHFRGVTTVVLKLFNLVQPDLAFFGQKDAQQCAVLARMVRDLNVGLELVICPTVREPDGLAMSSRNAYLSPEERRKAPRIYASLQAVREAYLGGERDARRLRALGALWLGEDPAFRIQYYEVVDPESLASLEGSGPEAGRIGPRGALVAVAAYLGNTRLIDNLRLN